jgi:hypothetical protein
VNGKQPTVSDPTVRSFLARNANRISSANGLPGPFHRGVIFGFAKPGAKAAIETTHGQILTGRVVMSFPTHAVLNMGGRHGTPGILTPENAIFVAGATL